MEAHPNTSPIIELTHQLFELERILANSQLGKNSRKPTILDEDEIVRVNTRIKRIKAKLILLGVNTNG